jgi:hypothetical protein
VLDPVVARAAQRGRPADVLDTVAEEPRSGPPAHWVERVRRGAPGLLEPSLRARGEFASQPIAPRVAPPHAELEPQLHARDEPEPEHAKPVVPRLRRAPLLDSSLRKVLRRKRLPSAVRRTAVNAPPAPIPDDTPGELPRATRSTQSSVRQPPERPRRVNDDNRPTPVPPSARAPADPIERPPRPSKVVEFEAPVERRSVRVERAVRLDRAVKARATRPLAAQPPDPEFLLDVVRTERVRQRAVVAPSAPGREPDAEHVRERAVQRALARLEPSAQAGRRDEPLSAVEQNRWPDLPPPLDQADGEVEVALRAWERQRRLDDEQTRL